MVKAINFAVRTFADNVVRGAVSGDGGSEFLQVGSGETVSLNLAQSNVLAYERQGNDLVLKLSDGREITLSGYFEANVGEDNKLYLSSNGEVTEVFLTDGGNGTMYANYGPVDTWNKFSNVDDIRFTDDGTLMAAAGYADDEVGMGMFAPALLGMGGGGLGAAAAVAGGLGVIGAVGGGGGGGGGGGPSRVPPAVNEATGSKDISTATPDTSVSVTGTGEPGEKVVVTVGTKTQETTINDGGTWETKFEGDNFPGDGTFEAVVKVTDSDGNTETLDGPGFVIDMTPPAVSTTEGTVNAGDIENLAEYQDGVTIKGEGEAGAKISVVVEGHTQSTTVGTDGTWTVTFTKAQIPTGENTFAATITATDTMGNKTVITDSIRVDTIPNPLSFNTTAEDNVINKAESSGEVTVTGQSTAGAMVTVTLGNTSQTVETASNGTWTIKYPAGTFTADGTNMTLTASTVDAAGNPSSTSQTIKIDTTTSVSFTSQPLFGGDNIINGTEANSNVTITGQSEAGTKSVSVVWNNTTVPATVAAVGSWTVEFPSASIPATGTSTATVNSIDAAGNPGTNTRTMVVDRETTVSVNAGQAGGDDIIMSTEADAGVTLTGKAEAGAKVEVTFQGHLHTVTASDSGTWSTKFESSEITRGTYKDGADNVVSVKAMDTAGNIASTTHTLNVDTEVTNFDRTFLSTGIDNVLNNDEAKNGLTVSGTVEAGARSVDVSFGTFGTYAATVTGTTWTVTVPAGVIPQGETQVKLTATAKDALGNVSLPHTEMVDIDRIVTPFTRGGSSLIGDDSILNATEVANGLNLGGTGERGSNIVVRLSNGAFHEVQIGDSGTWSTRFEANELPRGNGTDLKVTFEATDMAGNIATFSENVTIDTVAPDAPEVTAIVKSTSGTTGVSGVFLDETIDSSFTFHRVNSDGSHTQMNLKAGSLGSDLARFDGTTVPEGEYLVINHSDAADNDSATLLVTNNTGVTNLNLSSAGFHDFDFTSLDLTLAPTNVTISAQDLIAMTGPDNTLVVKGGIDDNITLQNGTLAADQSSAPTGYVLYTLGDNAASIYLDDDIRPTF